MYVGYRLKVKQIQLKNILLILTTTLLVVQFGNAQSDIEITFDSNRSHGAELLQSFNLRDSGEFVNLYYRHYELCQFSDVIEYVKQQALKKGGNLIILEKIMYPANGAKRMCYGIKGSIFRSSTLSNERELNNYDQGDDNINTRLIFYRPSSKFLRIHKVKIYNSSEEMVLEIKDGEEKVIELDSDKTYTFYTKRNKKNRLHLDSRKGQTGDIYIRVGIIAGALGPDGDLFVSTKNLHDFEMN